MADVLVRATISVLERPASAHRVLSRLTGSTLLTAAGLSQSGPRIPGFQNTESPKEANHERSTRQTKPFFPLMAVSYPSWPNTKTSASLEIEAGAARRASAISSDGLAIRYCSTGAMLENEVFFPSCAPAGPIVPNSKASPQIPGATAANLRRTTGVTLSYRSGPERIPTCFAARIDHPRVYIVHLLVNYSEHVYRRQ